MMRWNGGNIGFGILFGALCALIASSGVALAQDSFLSPMGPVAEAQRDHLLRVVGITMIAIVPVLIATPLILWRYHRRKGSGKYAPGKLYRPDWEFSGPLEIAMWGVPFGIVSVLGWWLWHETNRLDPYAALGDDPLEVQVIGLDWKWVFLYPEQGIATMGELAIPVNRPVRLSLTTDTVMQSFRISALAGQIYAMPGMRTEVNILASRAGKTRGENTQYNGSGFAEQSFVVTAMEADDWDRWTGEAPDRTLTLATYADLARAATPAETLAMLGIEGKHSVRFDLGETDIFENALMRYHRGAPVPTDKQPGAPAYGERGDE